MSDFSTLQYNYAGSGAGNDLQGTRSTAFANVDYFVVADHVRATDGVNKDFAVNLIGKGPLTVMTNTAGYTAVKWEVTSYGTYNNGAIINGYPYDQPQNGQVIAHIISTHALSLATDTTWMHENYDRYQVTYRMRASIAGAQEAGFITIMETGSAGDASKLAITNFSSSTVAAARVIKATDGYTDHILSQRLTASQSFDGYTTDGKYAYIRNLLTGLDSIMLAEGTSFADSGGLIVETDNVMTFSTFFDLDDDLILGTVSADNFAAGTQLRFFFDDKDIISTTLNGLPISFANNTTGYDYVTLPTSGELVINLSEAAPIPTPAAWAMGFGALGYIARRRSRNLTR